MTSDDAVVDEINALRNDLVEPDGILEELKKIRNLLESIDLILVRAFSPAIKSELGKQLEKRLNEKNNENK